MNYTAKSKCFITAGGVGIHVNPESEFPAIAYS